MVSLKNIWHITVLMFINIFLVKLFTAPLPVFPRGIKRTLDAHQLTFQLSKMLRIDLPFDPTLCLSQTLQATLPENIQYSAFDSDADVDRLLKTTISTCSIPSAWSMKANVRTQILGT